MQSRKRDTGYQGVSREEARGLEAHSCSGQSTAQGCSGGEYHAMGALRAIEGERAASRIWKRWLDQIQSEHAQPPEDALARCGQCREEHAREAPDSGDHALAHHGQWPRLPPDVLDG